MQSQITAAGRQTGAAPRQQSSHHFDIPRGPRTRINGQVWIVHRWNYLESVYASRDSQRSGRQYDLVILVA